MKLAEKSLSGARQVQDSSGEICSGPVTGGSSLLDTFRGVRISVFWRCDSSDDESIARFTYPTKLMKVHCWRPLLLLVCHPMMQSIRTWGI